MHILFLHCTLIHTIIVTIAYSEADALFSKTKKAKKKKNSVTTTNNTNTNSSTGNSSVKGEGGGKEKGTKEKVRIVQCCVTMSLFLDCLVDV